VREPLQLVQLLGGRQSGRILDRVRDAEEEIRDGDLSARGLVEERDGEREGAARLLEQPREQRWRGDGGLPKRSSRRGGPRQDVGLGM